MGNTITFSRVQRNMSINRTNQNSVIYKAVGIQGAPGENMTYSKKHIVTGNESTTLTGATLLGTISIGNLVSDSANITIYDGTVSSANQIANINAGNYQSQPINFTLQNGGNMVIVVTNWPAETAIIYYN